MFKLRNHFSELELFRAFRVLLGLFLFYHYILLQEHLEFLFSEKLLGSHFAGSLNILSYSSSVFTLNLINTMACVLSVFVCINFYRRVASLILLYIHYCYLHKNYMILNVSYDYLGWLLLSLIIIPNESDYARSNEWHVPKFVFLGGWLIFGLGYTLNGILKIQSPFWSDGIALSLIIPNDRLLANEFVKIFLMSLPLWILKFLTWITVGAELLCFPLILFKESRRYIWIAILLLHFNALLMFKIKDLSVIMILFSLFIGIDLFKKKEYITTTDS